MKPDRAGLRGTGERGANPAGVRAVFIVYLTVILSGIAFYAVIGLTHN